MITKKALIEAIDDLSKDFFSLAIRVSELESEVYNVRKKTCTEEKKEKRGRGRPRKNKE